MPALDDDPRWRLLHDASWTCPCCGTIHGGVFDIRSARPDPWMDGEAYSPNSTALFSEHFLSEDFCVLEGRMWFVRCVLPMPIIESGGSVFAFGVWAVVFKADYDLYLEYFDDGDLRRDSPWKARLANGIKGYPDTFNLKGILAPQPGRDRPSFEIAQPEHPLAAEQRNGITFDRLLEIYAVNGHDIRAALQEQSGLLH